jgi:hypothetical protein
MYRLKVLHSRKRLKSGIGDNFEYIRCFYSFNENFISLKVYRTREVKRKWTN